LESLDYREEKITVCQFFNSLRCCKWRGKRSQENLELV
jgi:hypothetical protein